MKDRKNVIREALKNPKERVNQEFPKLVYNPDDVLSKMEHLKENYYGIHKKPGVPDRRGVYVECENDLEKRGTLAEFNLTNQVGQGAIFQLLDQFKVTETDLAKGHPLEGYYKPPAPGKPVIMNFHGNGGTASLEFISLLPEALERGYGIYCPEYNSYSTSPLKEKASATGLMKDAERAAKFLEDKGIGHADTIVYGVCLGSCSAIHLAEKNSLEHKSNKTVPYRGLVVDSPMTSSKGLIEDGLKELAREKNITLPPGGVSVITAILSDDHKIQNQRKMQNVVIPTTVIFSPEDEVVPSTHHEAVFNALPKSNPSVKLYKTPQKGHIAATMNETMDEIDDLVHHRDKSQYKEKSYKSKELTSENAERYLKYAFQEYIEATNISHERKNKLENFADLFATDPNRIDSLQGSRNTKEALAIPTWPETFHQTLIQEHINIRMEANLQNLPEPKITLQDFCEKLSLGVAEDLPNKIQGIMEEKNITSPELQEYVMNRTAEVLSTLSYVQGEQMLREAESYVDNTILKIDIEAKKLENQQYQSLPVQTQEDVKIPDEVSQKHKKQETKNQNVGVIYKWADKCLSEVAQEEDFQLFPEHYQQIVLDSLYDNVSQSLREELDHGHLINNNGDFVPKWQQHVQTLVQDELDTLLPIENRISNAINQTIASTVNQSLEDAGWSEERDRLTNELHNIIVEEINSQREGSRGSDIQIFDSHGNRVEGWQQNVELLVQKELPSVIINYVVNQSLEDAGIDSTAQEVQNLTEEVFNRVTEELQAQREGNGSSDIQIFDSQGQYVEEWGKQVFALTKQEFRDTRIENVVESTISENLDINTYTKKEIAAFFDNITDELEKKAISDNGDIILGQQEIEKLARKELVDTIVNHTLDQVSKDSHLSSQEEEDLCNRIFNEVDAQQEGKGNSDKKIFDDNGQFVKGWDEQIRNLTGQELQKMQQETIDPKEKFSHNELAQRTLDPNAPEEAKSSIPENVPSSTSQHTDFFKQIKKAVTIDQRQYQTDKSINLVINEITKGINESSHIHNLNKALENILTDVYDTKNIGSSHGGRSSVFQHQPNDGKVHDLHRTKDWRLEISKLVKAEEERELKGQPSKQLNLEDTLSNLNNRLVEQKKETQKQIDESKTLPPRSAGDSHLAKQHPSPQSNSTTVSPPGAKHSPHPPTDIEHVLTKNGDIREAVENLRDSVVNPRPPLQTTQNPPKKPPSITLP